MEVDIFNDNDNKNNKIGVNILEKRIKLEFLKTNNFKSFKYPPSLNVCKGHLLATKFSNTIDTNKLCVCCGYSQNVENFTLKTDVKYFSENGSGYSLYFYFFIFIVLLLTFPLFITSSNYIYKFRSGAYCNEEFHIKDYSDTVSSVKPLKPNEVKKQFAKNYCEFMLFYNYNDCTRYYTINCNKSFTKECSDLTDNMLNTQKNAYNCQNNYYNKNSFANNLYIKDSEDQENFKFMVIEIFTIAGLLLMIFFWKLYEKSQIKQLDKLFLTLEDFTVLIKNLPKKINKSNISNYKYEIKRLIEDIYIEDKKPFKIEKIILGYNMEGLEKIKQEISKKDKDIKKDIIKNYNNVSETKTLLRTTQSLKLKILKTLGDEYSQLESDIKSDEYKDLSGVVFVIFKTEEMKKMFTKYCKKIKLELLFEEKNYKIKVRNSYEPTDVIWENLHYSYWNLKFRRIFVFILTLICSLAFISFIVYLTILTDYYSNNSNNNIDYILGLIISNFIIIFNSVFQFILKKFVYIEKHKSQSEHIVSESIKIYRFQLFNTVIPMLISAILRFNYFGNFGLIYYLNYYFVSNIILTPILTYFGDVFYYYYKVYLRYYITKNIENCGYVQEDAQTIFEDYPFYISYNYAYILLQISLVLIFLPIFPLSCFYVLLALCIKYFLDKYILITRCNKKLELSFKISKYITKELNYFLLYFTFGLIIRDFFITIWDEQTPNLKTETIIFFIISVLNLFIDIPKIITKYYKADIEYNGKYEDMIKEYPYKYEMTNPFYMLQEELKELDEV